ncbi:sorbitol dehydrogenase [Exaiptasia diaphana]|uniref:Sorbitol dehydrogenase n=1 Tax=Exaiptasia diaphana TaxID=2652724 RepID=A0A913YG68_EXADI|nr:sorbitol dehydrogenase [Exaiptasia diaphana]
MDGFYSALDFKEGRAVFRPKAEEVQLAIQTVGICGTDIHFWKHGEAGGDVPDAPVVLGHESSGVVTALGEGVTHLQIGDRVAIEPNVPCHTCQDCKEGRYNLCKKLRYFAVPPYQGALCRRLNHSAHFCYKIPDHVSFEEAALLEPLSVAIHG